MELRPRERSLLFQFKKFGSKAQKRWEAQVQPRDTIPSHLDVEWNLSTPPHPQEATSGTSRISLSARRRCLPATVERC